MPTAGTTHDAVLDGLGLYLVPNTLRKFDITNFSPAIRSGSPRYSDFSLSQFWEESSWHHGRGSLEWGDPFSFYDSTNVDTSVRGQVTLAPLQNLTTKAAAASVNGAALLFRLFTTSANLWAFTAGANRDAFQWTNASTIWTAETAGLTADPTDAVEFRGNIFVGQGTGTTARVKSGGVWANTTGVWEAQLFTKFKDLTLYRAVNINEIYWTTVANPAVADWTGPLYVGDTNTNIRGLAVGDGKIWVGKDDGLYYIQDQQVYQQLDYQSARDSNNFVNMKWWQGALYYPILDGLYRLMGSSAQAVGPDLGAAGAAELSSIQNRLDQPTYKSFASGKQGRIVDLVVTDSWLYAVVDGTASGTSQIVKYNGQGWHQVLEGAASAKRIRAAFFTGSLAATGSLLNPRLWYSYDVDIYNVILPHGTEDPTEYSLATYAATGTLTSPHYSADMANVPKEFQHVTIYSESMATGAAATSGINIQVAYELDKTGIWQNLTDDTGAALSFSWSPVQVISFPRNTTAKTIRLRFTFNTNDSTVSPKMKACVVKLNLRPDTFFAWQVTLRTGEGMENDYPALSADPGTRTLEPRDPAEWHFLLERYRQSRSRLFWDDGQVEPGITNFVENPSFLYDSNSDGLADLWQRLGAGVTASLDFTRKIYGIRSQKIVTTAGVTALGGIRQLALSTPTYTVGSYYTASAYVYLESGDPITVQILDQANNVLASSQKLSTLSANGIFTRLEATAQATAGVTSVKIQVARLAADATQATTFFVSACQVELTPASRVGLFNQNATTFCDGFQPRCYWSTRPALSTSVRPGNYWVFVTNIQRVERKRPALMDRIRGRGVETQIVFTLAEIDD